MRKTNNANHSSPERKAFVATEDRNELSAHRDHALEIDLRSSLERPTIVLALPGFDRQRLSDIGRGWCPLSANEKSLGRQSVGRKGWSVPTPWKLTACR